MSVFPDYSPKMLWQCTSRLVNTLFHTPPALASTPKSYFYATLEAHRAILIDLTGIIPEMEEIETCSEATTVLIIHESLQQIETLLYGTNMSDAFEQTIKGACLRTISLEKRLRTTRSFCAVL